MDGKVIRNVKTNSKKNHIYLIFFNKEFERLA